jgi:hypothetical protein
MVRTLRSTLMKIGRSKRSDRGETLFQPFQCSRLTFTVRGGPLAARNLPPVSLTPGSLHLPFKRRRRHVVQ